MRAGNVHDETGPAGGTVAWFMARAMVAVVGCSLLAAAPLRAEDAAPAAPADEPAMPLALHRAAYKITLLRATGTKSPTAARGRLLYEFKGSPREGFTQAFRQITEMQPAEGETRLSDMRSATFEDGKTFTFSVKTVANGTGADVVEGKAARKADDLLAIQLSKPKPQTLDVGDEVLFPTAHLQRIIAAARAGRSMLGVKVFDGSDTGRKVFDTTAVIGAPIATPAALPSAARAAGLDKVRRWPVSIAYFEGGAQDQGPAYVLAFDLFENGISTDLRFDYGDFVLGGDMTNLEILPPGQRPDADRALRATDTALATTARVRKTVRPHATLSRLHRKAARDRTAPHRKPHRHGH